MMEISSLYFTIGLILIIIGIILVIFSSIKMISKGKGESAGLILIGPIPIIWGTSRKIFAITTLIAAIIIFIVVISWILSITGG
ncbi:MAG: hypothetical protein DSO09_01870 [Candidatus Methanomethylicota archaeon]|jgi:uncharacterized membrane protein|uniref:DUF131 domain-containing protein n=1 Tax=Thermoproteota archaeon TaxID=2056631 RepID=A0A523BFI1_9CREN|nr:MAG: DUF131 domain-containing protein [Candidatus Verstraetearchaeota archaeon]TDA39716.1 MAG: hypothetical protein DSO09_01870 [Candidatus Verstraetearchaeota archaeon]